MTEETKNTAAPEYELPETIKAITAKAEAGITIDTANKIASYSGDVNDFLPEDGSVTADDVKKVVHHLNEVATGITHAFGKKANEAGSKDKSLDRVTLKVKGPVAGSHFSSSWKREDSGVIKGADGKETKYLNRGHVTAGWSGLGSPAGKAYNHVKELLKADANKLLG